MGRRYIPPAERDRILMLAKTMSFKKVAEQMTAEGSPIAPMTVQRIIKMAGVVRDPDSKTIVARKRPPDEVEMEAELEAGQEIQALNSMGRLLERWLNNLDDTGKPIAPLDIKDRLQVADRLIKIAEVKLKNNPNSPGNRMAGAISSFAELMAAAGTGEGDVELKIGAGIALSAGQTALENGENGEEIIDAEVEELASEENEGEEPRTATE